MKTLLKIALGLMLILPGTVLSQDWTRWKADSNQVQIVKTKNGSRIRARVVAINPEYVTIKIFSQTLDLPTDSIKSIKTDDRVVLDQEGRTKVLLTSTAISLGFYGWGIPTALRIKNNQALAASYLFIGAGGFFLPYYLTQKSEVSDAAATGYLYGSTRGIMHGLGSYILAAGERHWDHRNAIGTMCAASIAEGIGFYHLAEKLNYTGGRAEAVGVYGDFGLVNLGIFAPMTLGFDDSRSNGAAILLGSGTGLVAGHYLTANNDYTRGDAFALSDAGVLGGYAGLTIAALTEMKGEKEIPGCVMAGSLTGLAIGERLIRNKNFTTGQGWMIRLSMLAGALTGGGVAYLIRKEPEPKLYSSLSCLGALGGYAVMFSSAAASSDNAVSQNKPVHFYVNPMPLWVKGSRKNNFSAPVAGLQMMF